MGYMNCMKDEICSYLDATYGSMGYFYELTDDQIYLIEEDDNGNELRTNVTERIIDEMYELNPQAFVWVD